MNSKGKNMSDTGKICFGPSKKLQVSTKWILKAKRKIPTSFRDSRKNPSFKLTIPVSIADIYNGAVIKAKYFKSSACPVCQGTGADSPKSLKSCDSCGGKGYSVG